MGQSDARFFYFLMRQVVLVIKSRVLFFSVLTQIFAHM